VAINWSRYRCCWKQRAFLTRCFKANWRRHTDRQQQRVIGLIISAQSYCTEYVRPAQVLSPRLVLTSLSTSIAIAAMPMPATSTVSMSLGAW
jgi:hypothetical protein